MTESLTSRAASRTVVFALAAGVLAALLLSGMVGWNYPGPETGPLHGGGWPNRSRGWIDTRGIYPTEFSEGTGHPYTWTGGNIRLQIPNIDRSRSYRLIFTVEAPRPPEAGVAEVRWNVDGTPAGRHLMESPSGEVIVRLPTSARTRAVVTMEISPTFDPGPQDERALGVVIRDVRIEPEQASWSVTSDVMLRVAAASAFVVAGVLLCGVPTAVGWGVAVITPVIFAWLTLQDGAFLGDYAGSLFSIGLTTLLIGAGVAAVGFVRPLTSALPHLTRVSGMVLAASVIKLAFFSHPLVTIGDGIFQVHRSAMVQGGTYFFTSITPRPFFEFPYAIALFVAAMPFWDNFSRDVDHVWLLRTITLTADALVGIALYAAAWKAWRRERAATLIAVIWPFARAPIEALCNSNLPNAFGQGLFGVAVGILLWSVAGARVGLASLVAGTLMLAAAFLSHFSTFTVGIAIVGAIAVALAIGAGREGWRRAAVILVALSAAATLSYGVYYRHFGDVYRATIERVTSEEVVEEPGSAIAASPAVKLRRWWSGGSDDYGLPGAPLALLAVAGGALLFRHRRFDVFSRALLAWLLVWVGFTALGILTAVQMRVNLASAPVFVCLGAWALSALSERGRAGASAAAVAGIVVIWSGVTLWFMCIGH